MQKTRFAHKKRVNKQIEQKEQIKQNKQKDQTHSFDTKLIPFVIICWNNLHFLKNFINQIKSYNRKIIIINNNSDYADLLVYFNELKLEMGEQLDLINLERNYGHSVYLKLSHILPDIYMLSDPDLQLNHNLPRNFVDILYELSIKYKKYKVGFALNIDDCEQFIQIDNYMNNKSIYEWEKQFWQSKIDHNKYELYNADIDTTFCLVNNHFKNNNIYDGIRIAGIFTAKHLPWYKNYYINNLPINELKNYLKNNISSTTSKLINSTDILNVIHRNLKLLNGTFDEEIIEQKMSLDFITSTDRVLELGGNIGRNSLIISTILDNSNQLVVLECNKDSAKTLKQNRNLNNFNFTIIDKALSKHRLCQIGWFTYKLKDNEPILPGSFEVDTINLQELKNITNLDFNVLVCDCEGCLYNILIEEPSFLDNFEKVLLENDFWDHPEQESFVHQRLRDLGFKVMFKADLDFYRPRPDFWQAWIR